MPNRCTFALILLALNGFFPLVVGTGETISAGAWPSWRGPDRTGVSDETGLLNHWPEGGPRLLWKAVGLGGGYSTPSVANGRILLMASKNDDEFLIALNEKDGRFLWSTKVGTVGVNDGPNYPGPRSTPTIEADAVYALGSDGDLVCVDPANGSLRWRRHLGKDFEGNRGPWAYCESPLIDGDALICTPGGPSATLLALYKKDGSVIWKAPLTGGNQAGYASAIHAQVGEVKLYIQFLGSGLVGVAARDGQCLFRYNKNVGGQSCSTPIFHDGFVFSSAAGTGSSGGDALLSLSSTGSTVDAKEVYRVRGITNHHGGVVRIGDYLYGTGAALVCLDFKTGAVKWRERAAGRGSIIAADGHLYVRGDQGTVVLVEAASASYKEKGRFRQPHRSRFPAFCHPVVANGHLLLRDEDILLCYDVKAK